LSAITVALLVTCYVAFLTVPLKNMALVMLIPLMMGLFLYMGPTYALMQRLVADEMRATMMAVVMMLFNLIGMGIGPQVVGLISDLLNHAVGSDSLRFAMLALSFLASFAAVHFWKAARTVEEDLLMMQKVNSQI